MVVVHDLKAEYSEDHVIEGCEGLESFPGATTASQCAHACKDDIECSVWLWSEFAEEGKQCSKGGVAEDCGARMRLEGSVGQRVQHGSVNVISENKGVQTLGLAHYGLRQQNHTPDALFLVKRCSDVCHSSYHCTVWQYGEDGCWVETPSNRPNGTSNSSRWAQNMIAGQTIEHTCSKFLGEESLSFPWALYSGLIAVGAVILLGCLVFVGILVLAMKYQPTPRHEKDKRGMKVQQDPKPLLESRGTSSMDRRSHPMYQEVDPGSPMQGPR